MTGKGWTGCKAARTVDPIIPNGHNNPMDDLKTLGDGLFYPADGKELVSLIEELVEAAPLPESKTDTVVTPHAAYEFCGKYMASAFKALKTETPDRIVVICPVHRELDDGIYLPPAGGIVLPSGKILFDREGIDKLSNLPLGRILDIPYLEEPAMELQLPFIGKLYPGVPVLPIYLQAGKKAIRKQAAEAFSGLADSYFVVSTNLTDFRPREESRRLAEEFLTGVCSGFPGKPVVFDPEKWQTGRKGGKPAPCGLDILSVLRIMNTKKYPENETFMEILSWGPDTPDEPENGRPEDKASFYGGFAVYSGDA